MITPEVKSSISQALALLPKNMDSPQARVMLLAIGLQESRFEYRRQIGNGPAKGYYQFEKGGGFIMLVGLFFNVAALTANIKDLQITVQAGNTAYSTLASRATLLEFRVENHAAEIKHIKSKVEK